jgi:RNA polymerase sigma-70 factor, ECF subfamily
VSRRHGRDPRAGDRLARPAGFDRSGLGGLAALQGEVARFQRGAAPGGTGRGAAAARIDPMVAKLPTPRSRDSAEAADPTELPAAAAMEQGPVVPEEPTPESADDAAALSTGRGRRGGEETTQEVFDLVERAQAGDHEAFGRLYDLYADIVYRYIYFRVGSQSLAEDLMQETFLRALRRISSFSWQGRDLAAWFVTIARNLIADHFKSGRYRLEVATADMLDSGHDRPTEGPESEVLDMLTNVRLLEAVKQLNAEQQECVVLRFLQGLSVSETAAIMGKNDGAIKALQYRAVRTLARLLPAAEVR